jgi:protein-tyrosine phosphatase
MYAADYGMPVPEQPVANGMVPQGQVPTTGWLPSQPPVRRVPAKKGRRPYKLSTAGGVPPNVSQEYMQRLHQVLSNNPQYYDFQKDSMARVDTNVFLGSFRHAEKRDELVENGVTHVLNCAKPHCSNHDDSFYAPQNIMVQAVDASDSPEFPMLALNFDVCYDFLEHCRKKNGKVLIHCLQGLNRSSTVCVAYLMIKNNWDLLKTVSICHAARPYILPNLGFQQQLIEFAYANNLLDSGGKNLQLQDPFMPTPVQWPEQVNGYDVYHRFPANGEPTSPQSPRGGFKGLKAKFLSFMCVNV